MFYAVFNAAGRVDLACNDATLTEVPVGANELTIEQWSQRHDLLLVAGVITVSPPPPPEPTTEQIIKGYERAVQSHLDGSAKAAGYDSISTAVSYADEPAVETFQLEGATFRAWRSLCWKYCYDQLARVQAQQRTRPTVSELIAELPVLVFPS